MHRMHKLSDFGHRREKSSIGHALAAHDLLLYLSTGRTGFHFDLPGTRLC